MYVRSRTSYKVNMATMRKKMDSNQSKNAIEDIKFSSVNESDENSMIISEEKFEPTKIEKILQKQLEKVGCYHVKPVR